MGLISWQTLKDNRFLHVFLLCLAVFICYYGMWNGYYSTGDDFLITGTIRFKPTLFEAMRGYGNGVRFLNFGMIWVKTQLFGTNFILYNLVGMLQHLIAIYILYRFVEFLTKQRLTAFVAGLFFAVNFSYWQVLTEVSSSDYSFWAIFYLLTVTLFAVYLHNKSRPIYIGAFLSYLFLAFGHDFALNIPLVLIAYFVLLGIGDRPIRSLRFNDLKILIPFLIVWAIHLTIQLSYIFLGSSEAIYSKADYGPGLHMIRNLYFLVHLVFPNIPIFPYIANTLGQSVLVWVLMIATILSVILHAIFIYAFWKGSRLVKFAIGMVYLPFLQYTLWGGDFAGVSRYLYIPSVGFSILLALLLRRFYFYLQGRNVSIYRPAVSAILGIFLLFNVMVVWVWIQRHLSNSDFRHSVVTELVEKYQDVDPNSHIYIEVPDLKFRNVGFACYLFFNPRPFCQGFVEGEHTLDDMTASSAGNPVYWVRATSDGLVQVYPPPLG